MVRTTASGQDGTAEPVPAVRVLGPVGMHREGRLLAVGGPRTRRMLATLALHADRPVPVPVLVESAWGAHPPRTWREQVHNCVVRLRRMLSGTADDVRLERVGAGYRLEIEVARVDAHAFTDDVARARRSATAGDVAGAAAAIRIGLGRWYGDALGGDADGALATAAAGLDELRLAAFEDLFGHELALGNGTSVLTEITDLAARHPLREKLVLQAMTALRGAGRSAEALQTFRDHRRRMVHELGLEPERALRDLEVDILRGTGANGPAGPGEHLAADDRAGLAALLADLASLAAEAARLLRATTAG
ncbi:MAG TPA: AfsR/SARP family transcriptional regulator [Pilimelia sp.]|nr:AfsR/SARP family transcriptional regulator [Pilimelia sp.]